MTNTFDQRAQSWDSNPMHWNRSASIAEQMKQRIKLNRYMIALEYGAGTGILSFLLKDCMKEITLMDNSTEMVKVMTDKVLTQQLTNLRPLFFDLDTSDYSAKTFDLVFTQMALHHVMDYQRLLQKFYNMLSPNGTLAIADLYKEDGSFHGEGFIGHNGFDVDLLQQHLSAIGFVNISCQPCFVVEKKTESDTLRNFPVFLIVATKA